MKSDSQALAYFLNNSFIEKRKSNTSLKAESNNNYLLLKEIFFDINHFQNEVHINLSFEYINFSLPILSTYKFGCYELCTNFIRSTSKHFKQTENK